MSIERSELLHHLLRLADVDLVARRPTHNGYDIEINGRPPTLSSRAGLSVLNAPKHGYITWRDCLLDGKPLGGWQRAEPTRRGRDLLDLWDTQTDIVSNRVAAPAEPSVPPCLDDIEVA